MQYIRKHHTEPDDWAKWFIVPPNRRSYDYGKDRAALVEYSSILGFLIAEQHGLCAYCQQKITIQDASIEHIIPKSLNIEMSTSYYNVVAVCKKSQIPDKATKKLHCDSTRENKILPTIVFYSDAKSAENRLNKYFRAYSQGQVIANPSLDENTKKQVEAFIDLLHLNHDVLVQKRAKDTLNGILNSSPKEKVKKRNFLQVQYNRILKNEGHPFREYLLVYIGGKLGV